MDHLILRRMKKKKKMQNLSLQEYITEQEILTISICKKKKKKKSVPTSNPMDL